MRGRGRGGRVQRRRHDGGVRRARRAAPQGARRRGRGARDPRCRRSAPARAKRPSAALGRRRHRDGRGLRGKPPRGRPADLDRARHDHESRGPAPGADARARRAAGRRRAPPGSALGTGAADFELHPAVSLRGLRHSEDVYALAGVQPEAARARRTTGLFRKEGDVWRVAYGGVRCGCATSEGSVYLAELLRHPGKEIHSIDLVRAGGGGGVPLASAAAAATPRPRATPRDRSRSPAASAAPARRSTPARAPPTALASRSSTRSSPRRSATTTSGASRAPAGGA